MSMPLVALCADEECFRHPELLGLDGENLLALRVPLDEGLPGQRRIHARRGRP